MERVRLLNERDPPKVRAAPPEYQLPRQLRLAHDIFGYEDGKGRQKNSLNYYPNLDKEVESKSAYECRGTLTSAQDQLRSTTMQTTYTYVSLELGQVIAYASASDGYMKTY